MPIRAVLRTSKAIPPPGPGGFEPVRSGTGRASAWLGPCPSSRRASAEDMRHELQNRVLRRASGCRISRLPEPDGLERPDGLPDVEADDRDGFRAGSGLGQHV